MIAAARIILVACGITTVVANNSGHPNSLVVYFSHTGYVSKLIHVLELDLNQSF